MSERTRLFNGSTQPRVIAWGEGVIMPGESFETDSPEGYAPNQPGSAWTTDPEAAQALLRGPDPGAGDTSETVTEGVSGAQVTPQTAPFEVPPTHMLAGAERVHVEPDGNVVTDAGEIVGHVETSTPGGNA